MLFCSSVEVAGSLIPAGGVSLNAACDGRKRLLMRLTTIAPPAAKIPEIRAINKIWRAETLYIKVCLSKFLKSGKRWLTSLLGCSQNGRRCERLYQRRTAAASFIRRLRRLNLRANLCKRVDEKFS